jgi:hypothetical protein
MNRRIEFLLFLMLIVPIVSMLFSPGRCVARGIPELPRVSDELTAECVAAALLHFDRGQWAMRAKAMVAAHTACWTATRLYQQGENMSGGPAYRERLQIGRAVVSRSIKERP